MEVSCELRAPVVINPEEKVPSAHGIGYCVDRKPVLNAAMRRKIPQRLPGFHSASFTMPGRTVWCSGNTSGLYFGGTRFECKLR